MNIRIIRKAENTLTVVIGGFNILVFWEPSWAYPRFNISVLAMNISFYPNLRNIQSNLVVSGYPSIGWYLARQEAVLAFVW